MFKKLCRCSNAEKHYYIACMHSCFTGNSTNALSNTKLITSSLCLYEIRRNGGSAKSLSFKLEISYFFPLKLANSYLVLIQSPVLHGLSKSDWSTKGSKTVYFCSEAKTYRLYWIYFSIDSAIVSSSFSGSNSSKHLLKCATSYLLFISANFSKTTNQLIELCTCSQRAFSKDASLWRQISASCTNSLRSTLAGYSN